MNQKNIDRKNLSDSQKRELVRRRREMKKRSRIFGEEEPEGVAYDVIRRLAWDEADHEQRYMLTRHMMMERGPVDQKRARAALSRALVHHSDDGPILRGVGATEAARRVRVWTRAYDLRLRETWATVDPALREFATLTSITDSIRDGRHPLSFARSPVTSDALQPHAVADAVERMFRAGKFGRGKTGFVALHSAAWSMAAGLVVPRIKPRDLHLAADVLEAVQRATLATSTVGAT